MGLLKAQGCVRNVKKSSEALIKDLHEEHLERHLYEPWIKNIIFPS